MTALKIRLVVVFAPIHPDYRERYPKVAGWLDNLVRDLRMATVDDDTHILQLSDDGHFKADDFFDAFHLHWPAVQRLSETLSSAMPAAHRDILPGSPLGTVGPTDAKGGDRREPPPPPRHGGRQPQQPEPEGAHWG